MLKHQSENDFQHPDDSDTKENKLISFLKSPACTFLLIATFLIIGFISAYIYKLYEIEILNLIQKLDLYILILTPIFFIIGAYLVFEEPWSLISSLAFLCLLTIVVCGYLFLVIGFGGLTSPENDEMIDPGVHLTCIIVANIGIIFLMIASIMKNHQRNKQLYDSVSKPEEHLDE